MITAIFNMQNAFFSFLFLNKKTDDYFEIQGNY